MTTYTGAKS